MKLLAIMRPTERADVRAEIMRHADAELRAVWKLYRRGIVREMYSPGTPGAVLVLESDSVHDAERTLSELPLLANGVMALEVIELRPFTALEMLFSGESESWSGGRR